MLVLSDNRLNVGTMMTLGDNTSIDHTTNSYFKFRHLEDFGSRNKSCVLLNIYLSTTKVSVVHAM